MIYFYKRKVEWKISLNSNLKIHDEINSGSFDNYCIQGMHIKPIPKDELSTAILCFEEHQNLYSEIVEFAKILASNIWSFTIGCDFDYKKHSTIVQHSIQFNALICFTGNAVDYICIHSAKDLAEKFSFLKKIYSPFLNLPFYDYHPNQLRFPLLFHNSAASALAHEIFGHILEVDNFHRYNYFQIINLIQSFHINICDNPLIVNSPGFYVEDDMGIRARQTTIMKDGILNALIGCQNTGFVVTNALRRENYDQRCFPRMSNLLITPTSSTNLSKPSRYVQIDKLSKCFIYHTKKIVELNVIFSFLHEGITNTPIKPFKLIYDISDLLKKLSVADGGDMVLRPIQCSKHNQVINCGASSPDWMITYG